MRSRPNPFSCWACPECKGKKGRGDRRGLIFIFDYANPKPKLTPDAGEQEQQCPQVRAEQSIPVGSRHELQPCIAGGLCILRDKIDLASRSVAKQDELGIKRPIRLRTRHIACVRNR